MSQPPLVGRDDALTELRLALDQAEARRGQLLLVTGEPGIGKSTLADVVAREAAARGHTVLFGRAWELAEAPPYFPVWSGLRALGIEPPQGQAALADAFHLWERVLEALGRAAATKTVVWILEDLHAADLLTLDLLTFLARPVRALGVLVLVTTRDQDPRIGEPTAARLGRLCRDGRELRLSALAPQQVQVLAESITGQALDEAAIQRLCERTGGNPLFVLECARSYGSGPLPASVRALTSERVALLGPPAQLALGCGAIVGRDFSAAVVARMLGQLPAQVIERLTPALRAGILLEVRPGQYRFSHILVRDAVEESLGQQRCTELHAKAGAALDGDSVDVLVERARHALAALRPEGDPVGLANRAARALEAAGAPDRALALYQRVEEAFTAGLEAARPDPAEALHRCAVARAAGKFGEARRRCEVVLALARAAGDGALMARAALERGAALRPGAVEPDLVAALRLALALDPRDPGLRCRVEARLAAALQPADDPSVPMAMARQALAAARALGDPAVTLEVLQTGGAALVYYAPLDERLALWAEQLALAEAQGDRPCALQALARLAMDSAERGDLAAFDATVSHLRALSAELGHPRWRWRPLLLESMRATARGDFESSDRCLVELQQQASLTDDPALPLALRAHIAGRAVLFHRDDDVRHNLDRLISLMDDVPIRDDLMGLIRMGTLARQEDAAGAQRELIRLRGRLPIEVDDFRYLVGEGLCLVGSREECLMLRRVVERQRDRHMVSGHVANHYEGPNLRLLGLLDARLGETDRAVATLTEAVAGARARGHALWVAQLNYDLGRVLGEAGHTTLAAALFAEVAHDALALGMPGLLARARARAAAAPAPAAGSASASEGGSDRASVAMTREGDVWRVDAGDRRVRVRHSRGLELLARLVERPGEEVHVLALASDAGATIVEGDAGEMLDPQARRAYQSRLAELEEERQEADAACDFGRKARLDHERALLESELARAVGLGGRARPSASVSERARVNAQRRLKDAIGRISEADPALGARLGRAVHTGTYCCFRP